MEGLALTAEETIEVLSTYTASEQVIAAVATTPGWYVVGAFHMRVTFEARLAVIASVSNASLTLRARLFDLVTLLPLDAIISIQSTTDVFQTSPSVALTGGHDYQMQVEVTGGAGDTLFGALKSMQLVSV